MKKEISDHIASAFFEKRVNQKTENSFSFFVFLSACVLVILIATGNYIISKKTMVKADPIQHLVLDKHDGPYILAFDFTRSSSKLVSLNIDMPDIDFGVFKQVRFRVKITNVVSGTLGSLKVGFVNKRRETSNRYISDIHSDWKQVSIPFSEFGKIYDWSRLDQMLFILEEWNLNLKKGELVIDQVEFSSN